MNEIRFRLADDDDRENIISLLNEVFSSQQRSDRVRTLKSWKWKNEENVFEETLTVVADLNGDIIGTGTLWPFMFELQGKDHLAYQTCSLAVSENFRGRGVFRNINRVRLETAQQRGASFLFSFPNSNSLPGYKKMDWAYLGKIPWLVKPLQPLKIARDKLSGPKTSLPHELNTGDRLSENRIIFDAAIQFNDELVVKKNADFFNWRYARHPFFNYGFLSYRSTESHTFGAVYSILEKEEFREMVLIDLIADSPDMVYEIVREAEQVARRYNAMFLAMMVPYGLKISKMLAAGYIPYPMKNLAVYSLDANIRAYVEIRRKWSLFAGLHDSI